MNLKTFINNGNTLFRFLHKYFPVMNTGYIPKSTGLTSSMSSWSSGFAKTAESNSLTLTPNNFMIIPSCGLKYKGKLILRCKDCYYTRIDGEMYVLCSSYPRHKQKAKRVKEKYTWILTHACQSKLRPY